MNWYYFEFNLSNLRNGSYEIDAGSEFTVKVDYNQDGIWDAEEKWKASIRDDFEHKVEPWSVE